MARPLTTEQRKVLGVLQRVGRQTGATPKERKAAVEIGLVESGLTNPAGGDADSAGWRQERASIYKDPTNLEASAQRVYREMRAVRGRYATAGELAAAVQRPAAQYRGRYQQRSGEAQGLLGSTAQAGLPAGPSSTRSASATTPGGLSRSDLLQQYVLQRGRPGALEGLAAGLGGLQAPKPAALIPAGSASASAPLAAGGGSVKITGPEPGRVKPVLLDFARRVSTVYGKPIVGSDGTGHSRLTADGNVSQHTTGNATDVPARGAELIRMGQAALIAAGMPRAQARKQTGGLFNVGPHQIIFNTRIGGDHTTHLHISAK